MRVPGLREKRRLRGWSQQELAEKSGVSRDSISNYESGAREPRDSTVRRLARALGVPPQELVNPPVDWELRNLETLTLGIRHVSEVYGTLEEMVGELGKDLSPEERERTMGHTKRAMHLLKEGIRNALEHAEETVEIKKRLGHMEEPASGSEPTTLISESVEELAASR